MEKVEIEIDKQTFERVQLLAERRQCTITELTAEVIRLLAVAQETKDPLMGIFADEPELVDEILEEVMKNRLPQSFHRKNDLSSKH